MNKTKCKHAAFISPGSLQQWLQSKIGRAVTESENALVSQVVTNLPGDQLLGLGQAEWKTGFQTKSAGAPIWISDLPTASTCSLNAEFNNLPLPNDSFDTIYLAHCLEFNAKPHAVLREALRVLKPEGNMIITGLNPFSFWALGRLSCGWKKTMPWNSHFISMLRLKDWLSLLGMEVVLHKTFFFRPPWQMPSFFGPLYCLERFGPKIFPLLGGAYLMVARKKVIPFIVIKPKRLPLASVLVTPLATPSTRV
jgi:SAM-dependent methyltransferase